jgi:hypothetical protein
MGYSYELEFGSARQLSREGARERSTQHSRAEQSTTQHSTTGTAEHSSTTGSFVREKGDVLQQLRLRIPRARSETRAFRRSKLRSNHVEVLPALHQRDGEPFAAACTWFVISCCGSLSRLGQTTIE